MISSVNFGCKVKQGGSCVQGGAVTEMLKNMVADGVITKEDATEIKKGNAKAARKARQEKTAEEPQFSGQKSWVA